MIITLTDEAKEQLLAAIEQRQPERTALRLEARSNGTAEFVYSMKMIGDEERQSDDVVFEAGGVHVVLDPESRRNLEGATLGYEDGILRSGFRFKNPNKPQSATLGKGPRSDLTGPVVERIQRLLDTELNPAVAAHGGAISLVGVQANKVYLSFGGGCHGCGMVDVTLKQGVEARIKEVIPEIEEVADTTDHSTGENPFYA